MTRTLEPDVERQDVAGAHGHPRVAQLAVFGLVAGLLAVFMAVGALLVSGAGDPVDGAELTQRIDAAVAGLGAPASGSAVDDVLPTLTPKAQLQPVAASEVNVANAPNVPPPSGRTTQAIVEVAFDIVEGVNAIDPASGLEYETWGYRITGDEEVTIGTPGPIIRARVGDVLRFTVTNPATSTHPHNVDFHAVTGQGGGAADTVVAPGETKTIEARLLYPGIFMYHCAYDDVPLHISHGMHGGILVDPATPLPAVDRELYMVQSEYYLTATEGLADTDRLAVTDEAPAKVVFNGAVGSLTGDNAPHMQVGERMRIYFVNAGLNLDSNFHPIGSHWDVVYSEGATLNAPLRGSQTTLVPAGGGVVVELVAQVPQTILLVDHALSRTFDKGALGAIVVEGEPNPEIFEAIGVDGEDDTPGPGSGAGGESVAIVAGSFNQQALDAADEFADVEDPADYAVNVLTVAMGTTVTWVNEDSVMHTVTDVNGAFDSGFLETGDSWSYTFDDVGEFEYFCLPHPWMKAKVVVTMH
jgi:nitrite reductase (NO-forming)